MLRRISLVLRSISLGLPLLAPALLAIVLLALLLSGKAKAAGLSFTFTLPHAYTTSAGVYDASGHLVKHLWTKRTYSVAGTYSDVWDGSLDTGGAAPVGSYTVKVLYHNMSYSWEGVIGNTSASLTGRNRWTLDVPISDLAATPDGTTVCTANGYSEGKPSASRFAPATPQAPTHVVFDAGSDGHANSALELRYVATDGRRAYYANIGTGWGADTWASFVFATSLSDNSEFLFQNPQSWKPAPFEHTYLSVVDKTPADANGKPVAPPTGIAVQQDPGTLLAVAHGAVGQVRLFDKNSGQPVGSFSVSNPQRIAFAPSGDLWIISGAGLQRFSGVGGAATAAASITDPCGAPLAVAVNPTNSNQVLVTWGGSSQQVKCYNQVGVLQWTLGQAGGYPANGPAITNDKFDFFVQQNTGVVGASAGLTVLPDGSFWMTDPGDERNLHFDKNRVYLGQIAYIPLQHQCVVDPNNPVRAFDETGLEFSQDYSKPLLPGDPDVSAGGNGCWARVNNWGSAARALADTTNFTSVVTLSNGRTYGILGKSVSPPYPQNPWDVVELTSSGLRQTGVALNVIYRPDNNGNSGYLYANGDLRYRNHQDAATADPYYVQRLAGFDGGGNPQWAAPVQFGTAPSVAPYPWGSGFYPITASNVLVVYAAGTAQRNHLGGISLSTDPSSFAWADEPPVNNNIDSLTTGTLGNDTPPDGLGGYGINAFGGTCGTYAFAAGLDVFTYYNGQGNGMSNQWDQYRDDGLFVGQWGEASYDHPKTSLSGIPGLSYNSQLPALVQTGGVTYAFTGDEGGHGGIHRWRLDGQVRELSASAAVGSSVSLGTAGVWSGSNLILNPGFEAETSTHTLSASHKSQVTPLGWQEQDGTNSVGAFYTETGRGDAPSYPYYATHSMATDYNVYTYQDITGIPNGTYTVSARVRSSGGQPICYLEAKDQTTSTASHTNIAASSAWTTVQISGYQVSHGSARIALFSYAKGGQWLNFDNVTLTLSGTAAAKLKAKPLSVRRLQVRRS